MIPKEKAKILVDKMMYEIMYNCQPTLSEMVAKKCALIAVDEILDAIVIINEHNFEGLNKYWAEVKQEIEKL